MVDTTPAMSEQSNPLLGPGVPVAVLQALSPRADFVEPPSVEAPARKGQHDSPAAVWSPTTGVHPDEQLIAQLRRLSELRHQMR